MSSPTTWRILMVDDDATTCDLVKEYLEGESLVDPQDNVEVEALTEFDAALETLETRRFDVLILDIRLQARGETPEQEAGVVALEAIRGRRFVPVVFYTGLPQLVRHLQSPLIQVVEKTTNLPSLLEAVQGVFASRLPIVNRALLHHMEAVQRDYMWNFVAQNWEQLGNTPDRTALAYLLARRLAISLSGPGIWQLARELGDPIGAAAIEGRVHPMQYYIVPPVESAPLAGDLYHGTISNREGYWVLLTPSCDLVSGREKAEWVLFGHCVPLAEQAEYQNWNGSLPHPSSNARKALDSLLSNNRKDSQPERFHFLPGALRLPDLLVDFQQVEALSRTSMSNLQRLASLDSPFAEAMLSRFIRYFGRLGTPDLDLDVEVARLQSRISQ